MQAAKLLFKQIAEAIKYLHEHNQQIMIIQSVPINECCKLIDFSTSHIAENDSIFFYCAEKLQDLEHLKYNFVQMMIIHYLNLIYGHLEYVYLFIYMKNYLFVDKEIQKWIYQLEINHYNQKFRMTYQQIQSIAVMQKKHQIDQQYINKNQFMNGLK
ncbi:unnamed protein product [Paramecium sonneborni]|uniref:Uncharacterized protein n=1 Tax=Paramecium sonneborni TaxID=65129 RepID=A0A8S1K586_9CILI|nr:unnamed protein product [Paramecium sonneborni]